MAEILQKIKMWINDPLGYSFVKMQEDYASGMVPSLTSNEWVHVMALVQLDAITGNAQSIKLCKKLETWIKKFEKEGVNEAKSEAIKSGE